MLDLLLLSPVPTTLAFVGISCLLAGARAQRQQAVAPAPVKTFAEPKRRP